jgi:hypothetical protein
VALLVILTGVTDRHPSELPGHRGREPESTAETGPR